MSGVIGVLLATGGGSVTQVSIFDAEAFHSVTYPADATASYSLKSTGGGTKTGSSNWTWLISGVNSDYEVRATLSSGDTPTGSALSSWLALSTTRTWTLTETNAENVSSCVLAVEIRRVSDSVVIDTATITINALVN